MTRPSLARRCFAEAFATFALVFAGCGAIVLDSKRDGSLGSTGIAAAFGLVIMAMVYAPGHLSGAHINPAVSVAFRHPALPASMFVIMAVATDTRAIGATDAIAIGVGPSPLTLCSAAV